MGKSIVGNVMAPTCPITAAAASRGDDERPCGGLTIIRVKSTLPAELSIPVSITHLPFFWCDAIHGYTATIKV